MTIKIINTIKTVLIAGSCSSAISLFILKFFPAAPQNMHWILSVCFHMAIAIVLGVITMVLSEPKAMAENLLSLSLGRLLVSAIAFLIYRANYPEFKKWFMVHFMIHYALFTFFEIVFLFKIVNTKPTSK